MSTQINEVGHVGAQFGDEGVNPGKPNFNTIWERHGLSYSISSAVCAQYTNVTDRRAIESLCGVADSLTSQLKFGFKDNHSAATVFIVLERNH